ncbi:aluminum activated malate transporter family protein [Artemisia annua]|uniref:Aluminum activated malate transporter family protein n=1 Tax=Artemisia annua TaxID=35608 RepID=A0A2U1P321_ARTAN|nr:aluminum activated malate transporter family protein [Artemisia annua]
MDGGDLSIEHDNSTLEIDWLTRKRISVGTAKGLAFLHEDSAPPELRNLFKNEIQKVGTEGAKVLRELGSKVEKLEKLNSDIDLLDKVHEAAEELQMMIDQKSYHLVNSEKWGSGKQPKDFEDPERLQELKERRNETECRQLYK